jgi:hypothetical protein
VFVLFRPNFFMDMLYDPWVSRPAAQVYEIAKELPEDGRLVVVLQGTNVEGDDIRKTVSVRLGKPDEARKRLAEAGVTFSVLGDEVRVGTVKFGSRAKRGGFEQGWKVAEVKARSDAPSEHWALLPGFAIVAFVFFLQRRRIANGRGAAPAAA